MTRRGRPADYRVAIPSYQRPTTLTATTLPLLLDRGVDPDRVTVHLHDHDPQLQEYVGALDDLGLAYSLTGARGMSGARNAIADAYPAGTPLVEVDDDVRDVIRRTGPQTSTPVADLDGLFRSQFTELAARDLTLWGVYAVANPYFMRPSLTADLRYVVGALWGCINEHADHCTVTLDDKEDYERTIRHYLHAGGVLRRNDVAVKTRYYSEPGGMQVERTSERVTASAHTLVARYPALCSINTTKRSAHTEVRLRDSRRRTRTPPIPVAREA